MSSPIAKENLLQHLGQLGHFIAAQRTGLFLDLDGTLSELVSRPEDAQVAPEVARAMEAVRPRFALVAILTGRRAGQAREMLGRDDLVYVGNHGLERLEGGATMIAEEARPHVPYLRSLLSDLEVLPWDEGVELEDKGASFAVHFRMARDPERAQERILATLRREAGGRIRLLAGKSVINALPPVEVTKGTALIALCEEYALLGAIVVGDDVTDLDAFRAARRIAASRPFSAMLVAVLGEGTPPELVQEADYTLDGVPDVARLLHWLGGSSRPES